MLASRTQRRTPPPHLSPARVAVPRKLSLLLAAAILILSGAQAATADAQKPVNNLRPEVVGLPLLGERLVCGAGSWTGSVSEFTYEWLRDAVPIASGLTHEVTAADEGHSLWCVVTAVGPEGVAEAESSNSVTIPGGHVGTAPENVVAPRVSGKPAVGETIGCSTGTWNGSPPPALTYQWVRDPGSEETIVESASASTYRVSPADEGHSLACRVTATNDVGSASALSGNTLHIPGTKPENKLAPEVLGVEPSTVGESLTCSPGTWSQTPPPTFTYRWIRDRGLRDESVIESRTASTYTVESADQLHSLSCRIIATNSVGSSEASSANSIKVSGSRPQNVTPPKVSGVPAVGETLTCETGTWTGVPTPAYTYLWVRDQGTPGEEAIGAATSSTYVAKREDSGHSLSCEVTATNTEGSASRASDRVVVPAGKGGAAPENTAQPTISGSGVLGSTLTCSEGAWTGTPSPTLSYQWLRDGLAIPAATGNAYTVVEADQGHALACRVSAINSEGVASALSTNVVEVAGRAPDDVEAPQVAGVPAVGNALTCLRGTWTGQPAPTFSYQWLRDGTDIFSAAASTYTVASEDRGHAISCRVIAHNSAGVGEATSANSLEVGGAPPENSSAPEISGAPVVGERLTCSPGTWSGAPAPLFTFQWELNGVEIPSATGNTYVVVPADRGLALSCKVTATNREGAGSATSKTLHIPGTRPTDVEAPQVSGSAAVGQQLTCLRGIWNGQPPPTFSYEWLRDGTSILSATSSTYTVELGDQGHLLSCEVIATNSEGRAEAESANAVAILRPTARSESRPVASFPPAIRHLRPLTASQLLALLRTQLARSQRHARLSLLQRTGLFAFSFAAPAAGKLELAWYEATQPHQTQPQRARRSTARKPVALAQVTTSFGGAATKTLKLRLTSAARHLIEHDKRLALTIKATFLVPRQRPVSWTETVVLSR
jgi:hypothetical protein